MADRTFGVTATQDQGGGYGGGRADGYDAGSSSPPRLSNNGATLPFVMDSDRTVPGAKARYSEELDLQVRQKKQREAAAKAEIRMADEKKLKEMESYNPFGRGGAGAPLRALDGTVISNVGPLKKRTELANELGIVLDKSALLMEGPSSGPGGGVVSPPVMSPSIGYTSGGTAGRSGSDNRSVSSGAVMGTGGTGSVGGLAMGLTSHHRGAGSLDHSAPWQRDEAARKAKEKQEIQ
ncbi:hypothetical protein HDU93_006118, partial [Gonapodya sp. JEL0774]